MKNEGGHKYPSNILNIMVKNSGILCSQISASGEKMYHDAYTIQKVEYEHLNAFNYVTGMVPFLLNLIRDVSSSFCNYIFTVYIKKFSYLELYLISPS